MSLYKKEAKEIKEFKVKLGDDDSEKVNLPIYGDDDRDETLLTLIKEYNMMIVDGDIFKEDDIGEEIDRASFTGLKKRQKLKAIKDTFGKFRTCLKVELRDKCITLTEDLPVLTQDNYEVDNTFGEQAFFHSQTNLVSKLLVEVVVEITKDFLQQTKKPRNQKIENHIRRVKAINNYIPLMKGGSQNLTERELIKTVILNTITNK